MSVSQFLTYAYDHDSAAETGTTSQYFKNLIICHSSLSVTRLVFYRWTKPSTLHTGHFWDSSVVGI